MNQRTMNRLGLALLGLSITAQAPPAGAAQADGKYRIIVFGPHPDDAEVRAGGAAAIWARAGHHVKFVSVTNGDIGHWKTAGGALALRRRDEGMKAAKVLGIEETQVLDIHDGELVPSLEYRRTVARLIREWRADIVIGPRPNDYHPDHRYTGVLVNDAAYMVTVPFFVPDVPKLDRNPLFLYFSDDFVRPNPFRPDVVVPLDGIIDVKVRALTAIASQFAEGGVDGSEAFAVRSSEAVGQMLRRRFAGVADKHRGRLVELFGPDAGQKVKYAEAFEVCEYGRQPPIQELRALFLLGPR